MLCNFYLQQKHNLSLIFDSQSIQSLVFDPLENEFLEGAVVGLYNEEDSFDLFEKNISSISFYFETANSIDNKDIQFGQTLTLRNITNEEQLNIRCDKGVFALIY